MESGFYKVYYTRTHKYTRIDVQNSVDIIVVHSCARNAFDRGVSETLITLQRKLVDAGGAT